jgi:hypothetical protein
MQTAIGDRCHPYHDDAEYISLVYNAEGVVMPTKVGIQQSQDWIPIFIGTTERSSHTDKKRRQEKFLTATCCDMCSLRFEA